MLATQRTELWDELERAIAEPHPHARELRKPNAEVVPMRHHDVAKLLEVRAECGQLGDKRGGRGLGVRRHELQVAHCAPRAPCRWRIRGAHVSAGEVSGFR